MTNESSKGQNTSAEETLRQRSFIELAQALTAQKSNTLGRPLTYCLTTFGCQMNGKNSQRQWPVLWMRSGITDRTMKKQML